ncbi:hypothetical protein F4814DRAFT_403572 [Daldinia grandis]|nr:hypothetical protein F4814DRAFT_403572 [Daldinia grandis]
MKGSTIFLPIITTLGISHALSIRMPEEDVAKAYNHTGYMSALSVGENASYYSEISGSDPTLAPEEAPDYIIPVSHWGCTRSRLRVIDMEAAVRQTIDWSTEGGRVHGKSLHIEMQDSASIFLCNCKYQHADSAPASEMWEFYNRLRVNCGEGRTGWIFSKKWEKGFGFDTKSHVANKHPKRNLCPPLCCSLAGYKGESSNV